MLAQGLCLDLILRLLLLCYLSLIRIIAERGHLRLSIRSHVTRLLYLLILRLLLLTLNLVLMKHIALVLDDKVVVPKRQRLLVESKNVVWRQRCVPFFRDELQRNRKDWKRHINLDVRNLSGSLFFLVQQPESVSKGFDGLRKSALA